MSAATDPPSPSDAESAQSAVRADSEYECVFDDDQWWAEIDVGEAEAYLAPEDMPLEANGVQYGSWGPVRVGIAPDRCKDSVTLSFSPGIEYYTCGVVFRRLFPERTALRRILDATNAAKTGLELCEEEFWAYVALILVGSGYTCCPMAELWMPAEDEMHPRPPFGAYMDSRRFDEISDALRLTNTPRPSFHDPFWAVRELLEDWNKHMEDVFTPGHTVCLDESMLRPMHSWMAVKRKPAARDAGYYPLYCAETGILFKVDLVEGKSRPKELAAVPNESTLGKTGALVMRMVDGLCGTGRVVVMDSAFCVVKAVKALYDSGLYATTLAKKRAESSGEWPHGVPGDRVREQMQGRPVGELHTLRGEYNGMPLCLHAVNHPGYTLVLLATYGSSLLQGEAQQVRGVDGHLFSYRRSEPISDYYDVRHAVDEHTNMRQRQRAGLEKVWGASKFWVNRQLAFVLSSTLVNAHLAYNHFSAKTSGTPALSMDDFKARVALDLLRVWQDHRNVLLASADTPPEKRARRRCGAVGGVADHVLEGIPLHLGPRGPSKKASQQWKCRGRGCSRFVRTRCSCDEKLSLCNTCYALHVTAALGGD